MFARHIAPGWDHVHVGRMADIARNGVRVTIGIWNDHGKVVFSSVDKDFGPKGLIGSFVPGSSPEQRARELLTLHGKKPEST
jgi:hypothetical protein